MALEKKSIQKLARGLKTFEVLENFFSSYRHYFKHITACPNKWHLEYYSVGTATNDMRSYRMTCNRQDHHLVLDGTRRMVRWTGSARSRDARRPPCSPVSDSAGGNPPAVGTFRGK